MMENALKLWKSIMAGRVYSFLVRRLSLGLPRLAEGQSALLRTISSLDE
jgi:hypothetical protein